MKRGQKVAVCYDGKWGRRVPGIVTGTRNGHHIRVRFVPYCSEDEKELEAWFRAMAKGHALAAHPSILVDGCGMMMLLCLSFSLCLGLQRQATGILFISGATCSGGLIGDRNEYNGI